MRRTKKNWDAQIIAKKNYEELITTIIFLYNPVSGYYFSQFDTDEVGDYTFNIRDNNILIDTINVNIYD